MSHGAGHPTAALNQVGVQVLDCDHRTPVRGVDGYPYVAIPEVVDGRIEAERSARISRSDYLAWTRRTRPLTGDIVVTRRGRVGDSAPIPAGLECAIGQNLVLLRSDGAQVDQAFLRWAARSPQWFAEVDRLRNVGAVFSSLNVRDIARIRIPLPPLKEQRAIAEVLGALDDKIAANTRLAYSADEWVRATWQGALVRAGDIVTVGAIASVAREQVDPASLPEGTVFVGLEHIPRRLMWLNDSGTSSNVTSAKARFARGDVLFGKLRPYFHKVVSAPTDGICSTDVLVVRAADSLLAGYLLAALASDSVVAACTAASEGTRMPRTSWKDLAAVEIPWPGVIEARRLSTQVDRVRSVVEARLRENLALAATRDALLPALMSGKLRVRDAERAVEQAV